MLTLTPCACQALVSMALGVGAGPTDLPTCTVPSTLNIGHWIQEDCKVREQQKWIEAYACTRPAHRPKPPVGHAAGPRMDKNHDSSEVSKLVETLLGF